MADNLIRDLRIQTVWMILRMYAVDGQLQEMADVSSSRKDLRDVARVIVDAVCKGEK